MAENEKNAPSGTGGGGSTPVLPKKKKKSFFKSKWFKRIIFLAVIVAVIVGFLLYKNYKAAKEAAAEATSKTSVISRGDITVKITGSGTVEPYDEYNIVPTVTGTIDASYFEEGDYVEEGDVLYKFDSTVADNAIKTAQNSIKTAQNSVTSAQNGITQAQTTLSNRADDVQKAKDNIAKLTIYANSTGKVSGLNLTIGNDASGSICTITDTETLLVKVPFNKSQFDQISVGDSVTVNIEKYMTTAAGTVRRKYSAAGTGSDGSVVYDVEILINDNVALPEGTIVTATVHTSSGSITSSLTGSVYYPDPTTVMAEQSGKVQKVYVNNGDWVKQGDIIAQLESTTLQDALKTAQQNYTNAQTSLQEAQNSYQNALTNLENAQSTLEDRQSDADDYTITAPISGVVLSKSYKAGDTIYGSNSTTLMVIADMSKMKFTISVDELDIASIAVGQEVEVTSDALEGVELVGYITNISKMGSSQNGVTNYPVEVTINDPGELMSGMNVSAEIIVSEATNVIRVPVSAVSYFNGSYYATVVGEVEGMTDSADRGRPQRDSADGEMPESAPDDAGDTHEAEASEEMPGIADGEGPAEGEVHAEGEAPKDDKESAETKSMSASQQKRADSELNIVLSGEEEKVELVLGISDDDYYEVISGLEVGQVVQDEGSTSSGSSGMMGMMGMMGGGGQGGGQGGGPGGNRGGPR